MYPGALFPVSSQLIGVINSNSLWPSLRKFDWPVALLVELTMLRPNNHKHSDGSGLEYGSGYHTFNTLLTPIESVAGVHPMAPEGLRPGSGSGSSSTYFNANPIEPKEGEYFSRSQLPKRFQYSLPKEDEADNILAGGAEIVF